MKKKITAVLLSMALCLCALSVPAAAADFPDTAAITVEATQGEKAMTIRGTGFQANTTLRINAFSSGVYSDTSKPVKYGASMLARDVDTNAEGAFTLETAAKNPIKEKEYLLVAATIRGESGEVLGFWPGLKSVTIAPAGGGAASVPVNGTLGLTATVLDGWDNPVSVRSTDAVATYTWSSGAVGTAAVTGNGASATVSGAAEGTASITCTARIPGCEATGSCTVTVGGTQTTQYKLTYHYNYDGADPATKEVSPADNKVTALESAPSREGWTFEGWYTEEALTNRYVLPAGGETLTADKELWAKWIETTPDDPNKITAIHGTPASLSMTVGDADRDLPTLTFEPETPTDSSVTWSSSDENVAKIVNNKIHVVGAGTANIIATAVADPNVKFTCPLTVTAGTTDDPNKITAIHGTPASLSMTVGDADRDLPALTFEPANPTDSSVTWSSSNEAVAKIVNNKIHVVGAGTADIIATAVADPNVKFTCPLTVTAGGTPTPEDKINSLVVSPTRLTFTTAGATQKLIATVDPTDASVAWSSGDESIATVAADGTVTAVGKGTTMITATATKGSAVPMIQTVPVTVAIPVPVTGITISESSFTVLPNMTHHLRATVQPEDADNTDFTWASSDPSVATVSGTGLVTALKEGTATITVTTAEGGFTDSCVVTVTSQVTHPVTKIDVVKDEDKVLTEPADKLPLTVTLNDGGTVDIPTLNWVVTDKNGPSKCLSVEMIDGKYNVVVWSLPTGSGVHEFTIYAQSTDQTDPAQAVKSNSITVKVKETTSADPGVGPATPDSSGSLPTKPDTTYPVNVPASAQGGKVSLSGTACKAGDTVTITVTPDEGYHLDTLVVKDGQGNELSLTKVNDTTYTFTMPKGGVTVTPTFAEGSATTPPQPAAPSFTDVPADAWYADAVKWAVENGITDGTSETTFSPTKSCTRAEMVTFLWKQAGKPEPAAASNPFSDVRESDWFYKAVLWAVEKGVTSGTGDGSRFDPYLTVTRAQAVRFLWNAEGKPAAAAGASFTDVPAGAWYADAVNWAVAEGITEGYGSATIFAPDKDCDRAQIVTFMYRAQ